MNELLQMLDDAIKFLIDIGARDLARIYLGFYQTLAGQGSDDEKQKVLRQLRRSLFGMGSFTDIGLPIKQMEEQRNGIADRLAAWIDLELKETPK